MSFIVEEAKKEFNQLKSSFQIIVSEAFCLGVFGAINRNE
jgi:hypothetical protein